MQTTIHVYPLYYCHTSLGGFKSTWTVLCSHIYKTKRKRKIEKKILIIVFQGANHTMMHSNFPWQNSSFYTENTKFSPMQTTHLLEVTVRLLPILDPPISKIITGSRKRWWNNGFEHPVNPLKVPTSPSFPRHQSPDHQEQAPGEPQYCEHNLPIHVCCRPES